MDACPMAAKDGDLAEVANEIEAKQKTMPIKPQMYGINRT
jgi:hypothetical protein